MKARVVRHNGTRFRSALTKHITYLKREGVIVSPEDAAELGDLRTFTRELMTDVARDLGTKLDWIAVDHWNADNPHVHVLIRGRAEDGQDLADQVAPGCWTLKPGIEDRLRDLSIRGDVIKTMHRPMSVVGREPNVSGFALHGDAPVDAVLGRLVERGLHDELKGSVYAIVEGIDGRTHHIRFTDIEVTGDAAPRDRGGAVLRRCAGS